MDNWGGGAWPEDVLRMMSGNVLNMAPVEVPCWQARSDETAGWRPQCYGVRMTAAFLTSRKKKAAENRKWMSATTNFSVQKQNSFAQ